MQRRNANLLLIFSLAIIAAGIVCLVRASTFKPLTPQITWIAPSSSASGVITYVPSSGGTCGIWILFDPASPPSAPPSDIAANIAVRVQQSGSELEVQRPTHPQIKSGQMTFGSFLINSVDPVLVEWKTQNPAALPSTTGILVATYVETERWAWERAFRFLLYVAGAVMSLIGLSCILVLLLKRKSAQVSKVPN